MMVEDHTFPKTFPKDNRSLLLTFIRPTGLSQDNEG